MYSIQYKNIIWITLTTANLENVSVIKSKEADKIFSRVKVDGSIKFYGVDYTLLAGYLSSLKVEARIRRDSTTIATGYINLLGSWDADNKVCELSFDVVDEYTPVFKLWDEDVSLFGLTSNQITMSVDSEQKEVRLLRSEYPVAPTPENNYTEGTHTATEWVYVKEYIDFPADGWDYDPDFTGDNDPWIKYEGYTKDVTSTQTVTITRSHFYELADVLEELCTESGCYFDTSDFSDYLDADSELNYLFMGHKKQIIAPAEFVKEKKISLSKMLQAMKAIFNLDWVLIENESSQFELKFKHPSEISMSLPSFTTYPAHDLTTLEGVNWSEQLKKYTYSGELPFKEVWSVEESMNEDFDGLPIRYNIESEALVEYDISGFQMNFKAILKAANDNDPGDISDNGFCLVACNSSNVILSDTGILSTDTLVNCKLSLSQLHYDHFRSGRYFSSGTLNGSTTAFSNVKKMRDSQEYSAPATIDDFNFDYLVKTAFGNGELISVTEYCNESFSKIKLRY